MWLLSLAAIGLLGPGGLLLYWAHNDYVSLSATFSDWLAMAYILDLVMSTFLLALLIAMRPIGPVKWYWFIALSLLGTLAFSIPFFLWLAWRRASDGRLSFAQWWREA